MSAFSGQVRGVVANYGEGEATKREGEREGLPL